MTRFQDGPAKGQTLQLRRAPVFLRVTVHDGKVDALDQLTDLARPEGKLYAYILTESPGFAISGPANPAQAVSSQSPLIAWLENSQKTLSCAQI